jgi:lipopolysaccharide transport system permease protein
VLFCGLVIGPTLTRADAGIAAQEQPLVAIEIRYDMPEAGQVVLVWGIDGWTAVREEIRPAGTTLVDSVMHTPMLRRGDPFVAEVQVPACSTVNYGFLVTESADGATIEAWDSNTDPLLATQDVAVDVRAGLILVGDQVMANVAGAQLLSQEIRYQAARASEVSLVWGINGWLPLPEEVRPVRTELVKGVMHTPMERLDGAFVARVQAPAGAIIDYGFLTTKTRRGATTDIWDGNGEQEQGYQATAAQDGLAEVQAPPSIAQQIARADPGIVPPWLGLVLSTGACLALGGGVAGTWIRRRSMDAEAKIVGGGRPLQKTLRGGRLIYLYDLLRELVVRDIKMRYKRSVLGMAWSLLDPLSHMLVFTFLSRRVLALQIPNYPAFVFIGTLAWSWFSGTIVAATGAITGGRELVRRPGFPVAILPVAMVTTNLIHFLLALIIPLLYFLVRGGRLTGAVLTLPLAIAPQFMLILGLSYLAATFQVTFRDTQQIAGVLFRLLYFLTPIFYDASMVPARYQALYRLNPMFYLITAYRAILMDGTLPDFYALLAVGALSGAFLWIGHAVFKRASYRFVEEL